MKYLLVLPVAVIGAAAGALLGILFLAIIPSLLYIVLVWGGDAYRHPEVSMMMMRPALLAGALGGASASVWWWISHNKG